MTLRHHTFSQADRYPVALLCKPTAFNKHALQTSYVEPLQKLGLTQDVVALTLNMGEKGKPTAKEVKAYLEELLPSLGSISTELLYVTDGTYFKALTKKPKAEPHAGYVLPCAIPGYEHIKVTLGINYQALVYNPELQGKLERSLQAVVNSFNGSYVDPGNNIIHSEAYPGSLETIQEALKQLHQYPELACDIEAFSLRFNEAGIGTITFCWDEHNGIAFPVDYEEIEPKDGEYGKQTDNQAVKLLLREFFETYQGRLTFHHASYDVKVIIYELWMNNLLDTEGLLKGLDIMTHHMDDTKIIAYLAYNSTAGNQLGLKALAHEFTGNYAQDEIHDIRRIPLKELLRYNLVDGMATNYVKKRDYPIMVQDKQEELYKGLMLDSLKLIIQLELTGMPMSRKKIQETKAKLEAIQAEHLQVIMGSQIIHEFNISLQIRTMEMANSKLKVKQHPLSHFADVVFNPNSGPQLQRLLYDQLKLPVIDLTDTKAPATGADTLEKLINHTSDPEEKAVLAALIGYGKVTKILGTFIPAFEGAISKDDSDTVWLHGCFNLGGTVSGRLSSSDPNLQNIPAGSDYGKLIKECFLGPVDWLFSGADFNSLEDYISALTTKDPNKLNVYIKGFDGHCLRAAYYFRDELPHIDLDDPKSVNSIKKTHPELRQDSKGPTFALTYQGTAFTLMNNLGWPEEKAKSVEANYHELYKVSDQYVQSRLAQASKDGFVEVAFGLRVRTPMLKQVVWGSRIPYEAAAEGRTAGNALGQSYGLLNNRAAVAFMKKVWASKHRYSILPVALIHDAIYLLIKDDPEVVTWANKHLIDEMRWQELPEIQHPTVKLGAALDLFWPNWANPITLPNDASTETILKVCREAKIEYEAKKCKSNPKSPSTTEPSLSSGQMALT